jgi:YggT family protein
MNGYFSEAGTFLIDVIFGFFILMVMLRFLLQTVRADFYNPISQFIVKLTDPMLRPLRRVIPGLAGIDMASIVLMLALKLVSLILMSLVSGVPLHIPLLLILSITGLIKLSLYILIFSIIIIAIASWIAPGNYNPVLILLNQITEPVMRPVRRRLPPMSGLDLSPMIALLLLYLIVMAVPYLEHSMIQLLR